jgi:tetratricopeptide (TPR) repeat protein
MKVYEEQKKVFDAQQQAAAKGKPRDGRPRWMVEAEEGEAGGAGWDEGKPPSGGFRDDDEDGEPAPRSGRPAPKANGDRPDRSVRDARHKQTGKETYISSKERADLLFADEPKSSYKSPARHRKPAATPTESIRSSRVATPVQLITRKLVVADPGQVHSSAASKSKGNEHFKLGRFTEAETAYSTAISSLPTGHILLVPLWNNRAAARLKLGHSEGVVTDCTAVIDLVGQTYHPSKETPLPSEFSDVKLSDALVKATIKRAQALEMAEKWQLAMEDWSRIMAFDNAVLGPAGTNTRNLAAEGMRRAKRMLESPGDSSQSSTQPAFKVPSKASTVTPRPQPSKPADVDRSKAVSELRKANAVNDAEDAQRMALKDSVEARLNAWKGGKESNLRALIASLDSVLWDEILQGGLKVGMHELIAEKQVKIKYMKVIARLHPDKVRAGPFFIALQLAQRRVQGQELTTW